MSKKIFYVFCILYIAFVIFLNYNYDLENNVLNWLFGIFLALIVLFRSLLMKKKGRKEK
ncbi:hypothetical protein APP_30940 [Aeribacillus pallidus]|nr:hypothetical protein APP_30940 [Aeribacillus pallidus]